MPDRTQILVELSPEAARALLAAEPFSQTNIEHWIEGRDALMRALATEGEAPDA